MAAEEAKSRNDVASFYVALAIVILIVLAPVTAYFALLLRLFVYVAGL